MKDMAKKIIRVDDLDGSEGAAEHTFALDGQTFTLDLTSDNLERLKDALEPFMSVATASRRRGAQTRPDAKTVRAWAEENGHMKKGTSGRIPIAVMNAYRAAH